MCIGGSLLCSCWRIRAWRHASSRAQAPSRRARPARSAHTAIPSFSRLNAPFSSRKSCQSAAPITRTWLREALQQIRRDGVAWAIDRYLDGLASVAAPLLDGDGRCLASLSIAGPSSRFKADLGKLIATVQDAAGRASGVVGGVHIPEQPPTGLCEGR